MKNNTAYNKKVCALLKREISNHKHTIKEIKKRLKPYSKLSIKKCAPNIKFYFRDLKRSEFALSYYKSLLSLLITDKINDNIKEK